MNRLSLAKQGKLRRYAFIITCLTPMLLLYFNFIVRPASSMLMTSLYKWSGLSPNKTFIGFDNFIRLFQDDKFWNALSNTVFLMVVVTFFTLIISLFCAAVLSRTKLKEKNFYRVIFFFPNVLSIVVIGTLFQNIYSQNSGILNETLRMLGLEDWTRAWLGDPDTVLWAIAAAMIWQAVGYYMVIYMAGMDSIDDAIYEAASIDGASKIRQFFSVTLPLLWSTIRVTLVFYITSSLNMSFLFVTTMTQGGTDGESEVLLSYMYKQGFTNANFGYGMAIASFIFVCAFTLASISNYLTRDKDKGEK